MNNMEVNAQSDDWDMSSGIPQGAIAYRFY